MICSLVKTIHAVPSLVIQIRDNLIIVDLQGCCILLAIRESIDLHMRVFGVRVCSGKLLRGNFLVNDFSLGDFSHLADQDLAAVFLALLLQHLLKSLCNLDGRGSALGEDQINFF